MKKYELVNCNESLGLYRNQVRTFSYVKLGDMGGWISCENSGHYGDAWVSGNAKVTGNGCQ